MVSNALEWKHSLDEEIGFENGVSDSTAAADPPTLAVHVTQCTI